MTPARRSRRNESQPETLRILETLRLLETQRLPRDIRQETPQDFAMRDSQDEDAMETALSTPETPSASQAATAPSLEDQIVEAIKTVYDPEIPVNIYELGLIYNVVVGDDGHVDVIMTLTSPRLSGRRYSAGRGSGQGRRSGRRGVGGRRDRMGSRVESEHDVRSGAPRAGHDVIPAAVCSRPFTRGASRGRKNSRW